MNPVEAGFVSVESDGFTVSGNGETAEAMEANLTSPKLDEGKETDEEKVSKAAATLGEKGGKASAEKRAAASETKEEPTEDEEKPLGKPRDDPKARMLEATRKEAEAKRELAAERRERERISQELASERAARQVPAETKPTKKPDTDEKPVSKDFEDYEEFVEARSRWAARQEYQTQQENTHVRQQADAWARGVVKTMETFEGRVGKLQESDPAFRERISEDMWALKPSVSLEPGQPPEAVNIIADEILASESGPLLMLHFTEHPETFQRIASLRTPRDVAREMAKVEARLEAATAGVSSKPVASTAKPPVRPVTGSPGTVERDEDSLSFEEFYAHDSKRAARR